MSDLLHFYGKTDGASGTFSLIADELESAVTSIKVDKGLAMKIWSIEVNGASSITVIFEYSIDGGTSWNELKRFRLSADGRESEEFRRPIVIEAKNDDTYVRARWESGAADIGLSFVAEFDEMQ